MHTILACLLFLSGFASEPDSPAELRAAVMEHADQWTGKATGARWLLEQVGFQVEPLTKASIQRADLIVFGTFTNNDPGFHDFVSKHRDALLRHVEGGGVILELAQSDQSGARVAFLPEGCEVLRCDRDHDQLRVAIEGHTLASGAWLASDGATTFDVLDDKKLSWEVLNQWTGCQAVLYSGGSGEEYAALVEAAHGKGRVLVSSLWLDKLRDSEGMPVAPESQLQAALSFGAQLAIYVGQVRDGLEPDVKAKGAPIVLAVGPMLGHISDNEAHIWMRPVEEGRHILSVRANGKTHSFRAEAKSTNDRCVVWKLTGLEADTHHSYQIESEREVIASGPSCQFWTAPDTGQPSRVALAFGSCAGSEPSPIWSTIELAGAEGLVLMGDTPYIDTTDLQTAREKHRRFLELPGLARLGRSMPVWATWDDHDFGRNNADGNLAGKENSRQAFVEYRALRSYGDGELGIYTSFRRGPLEVFLLDTRYFSRTAPIKEGSDLMTLLGDDQWKWLEASLRASSAAFKVLACGMIWDDKKNSESDDWGHYPHERERIESFIGKNDIGGVILLGGDIHVSRHLAYPETVARAGYQLEQLIVSPMHGRTIPSLDIPHPALLWSSREPNVFLMLEASTLGKRPTLSARWIKDIGRGAGRELRRVDWTLADFTKSK
ncbi:MAG: hypothetical protein ACI841_002867 [Planctomycetota bacterium]|jgi:hypothetical protein